MLMRRIRFGLRGWEFHLMILAVLLLTAVVEGVGIGFLADVYAPTPYQPPLSLNSATNSEIITAFQRSGLVADVIRGASKDERDGLSAFGTVETTRFRISRKENELGMIIRFRNYADLERMTAYYRTLNKALPQYGSWIFAKEKTLLQINIQVPESVARKYEMVLYSMNE
jgi:hypothetical protein